MAGRGASYAPRDEPSIQDSNDEDDFRTVTYSRALKQRIKRKREGSVEVENISLRSDNSSDDEQTVFSTPTQVRQSEFKVLITPIDRTKSLRNVNPIIRARQLRDACPTDPEFIKPTAQGLLIKCRNQKQLRAFSQISVIGTIPVKAVEKQVVEKGVIYGVSTEMKEKEILNELKHHGVVDVKRITKRSKSNTDTGETSEESEPTFIPMTSVILSFNKPNLPSFVTIPGPKSN